MGAETSWGDDTVSLGPREAEGLGAESMDTHAASEARSSLSGDQRDGGATETVVRAGRRGDFPRVGRRESARRPALLGAAAGLGVAVLALSLAGLIGNGGQSEPQLPAASARRKPADRPGSGIAIQIKDAQRERRLRAAHVAHERRRRLRQRRQRRREVARDRARPTTEAAPAPVPEAEAEYVPEYSPEPVPEAAPAPQAAPPAAGSPTPPGVEFGM